MKRSKIFSGYCNTLQWFLMSGDNYKLRKNHINCRDVAYRQGKNKRRLSAEGCSLLPSALRPRLLERKFTKNARFLAILALFQIVAASTIFGYLCSTPVSAASLTLTIPSSFSIDITPGANGVFSKSSEQKINVKTDNTTGYTLSIKAKNGENSNSLLNGNNKLNSISESTTEDLFKSDSKFNNSWGYLPSKFNSENNTNFLPGPITEESILEATEEANNETGTDYNITLGAKVDSTIPSGSYNNDFVLSAMANEPKYNAIMQNWNGCNTLGDGQTIKLLDNRDNNIYTVAKLKDDKCWMTQNLRIQDKEISSEDSDIEDGTFTIPPSDLSTFSTSQNKSYVYVNANSGYYSWHAATAGQNNVITGGSVDSICPKGWHLPTEDEFSNLIANSNYTSSTIKAAPANFTTQGYVYNKKITNSGTYGYYWSASNYYDSTTYSDIFRINSSSSSNPNTYYSYRYYGNSIRCISGNMEVNDYKITYDLNGGSGGPSENPQIGKMIGSNTRIYLNTTAPTKLGFFFYEWCDTNNSSDILSCPGTSYDKDHRYALSKNDNVTFYAMYKARGLGICNETGIIMKDNKCWGAYDVISYPQKYSSEVLDSCNNDNIWRLPSAKDFSDLVFAYYPSAESFETDDGIVGYHYNGVYSGSLTSFTDDWGKNSGHWWTSDSPLYIHPYAYWFYINSDFTTIYSFERSAQLYDNGAKAKVRCVSDI